MMIGHDVMIRYSEEIVLDMMIALEEEKEEWIHVVNQLLMVVVVVVD